MDENEYDYPHILLFWDDHETIKKFEFSMIALNSDYNWKPIYAKYVILEEVKCEKAMGITSIYSWEKR